jgi:hypothetical protein
MFVRAPRQCAFDLDHGVIHTSPIFELTFYFGPTPKEIFERHQLVTGNTVIDTPLPDTPIDSWDALSQLVRTLNQWSLSAMLYPRWNASTSVRKGEIAKRLSDLFAVLPILYETSSSRQSSSRQYTMDAVLGHILSRSLRSRISADPSVSLRVFSRQSSRPAA